MPSKYTQVTSMSGIFSDCIFSKLQEFERITQRNGSSFVCVLLDLNETSSPNVGYTFNDFIQDLSSSKSENALFCVYERTESKIECKNVIGTGVVNKSYLFPTLSHPQKLSHGDFIFFDVKNYIPLPSSIVFNKALTDRSLRHDKISVLIILLDNNIDFTKNEELMIELQFYISLEVSDAQCVDVLTNKIMKYVKIGK